MNFLVAIKFSSDFLQGSSYEKIKLKCVVLSIVLATRPGTILPVVREITHMKKVLKCIILELSQEYAKEGGDVRS